MTVFSSDNLKQRVSCIDRQLQPIFLVPRRNLRNESHSNSANGLYTAELRRSEKWDTMSEKEQAKRMAKVASYYHYREERLRMGDIEESDDEEEEERI